MSLVRLETGICLESDRLMQTFHFIANLYRLLYRGLLQLKMVHRHSASFLTKPIQTSKSMNNFWLCIGLHGHGPGSGFSLDFDFEKRAGRDFWISLPAFADKS